MTIVQGITQGLIQGFTEFLPVSSSGHLSVYQYITGNSSEEAALFSLFLHAGTLIAVFVAFWGSIYPLIAEVFLTIGDIFKGRFEPKNLNQNQRMIALLFVGLLPLVGALIFKDYYRAVAADNSIILEGICFLITAVLLFTADHVGEGYLSAKNTSYRIAIAIGIAQAIAPLPGISRSGSTLAIALILGLDTQFALSYSFILGIPAVLGGLLLDLKDVLGLGMTIPMPVLIAGFVSSAIAGLASIFLIRLITSKRRLSIFSIYLLILGMVVLVIGSYDSIMGYPIQHYLTGLFA